MLVSTRTRTLRIYLQASLLWTYGPSSALFTLGFKEVRDGHSLRNSIAQRKPSPPMPPVGRDSKQFQAKELVQILAMQHGSIALFVFPWHLREGPSQGMHARHSPPEERSIRRCPRCASVGVSTHVLLPSAVTEYSVPVANLAQTTAGQVKRAGTPIFVFGVLLAL